MQINSRFNQLSNKPDLTQVVKSATLKNAQELNCVRIGIIKEFYPETLTAKILLANKKVVGINPDGTQQVRDYAPIIAKVCYCNPFCTFPLTEGMECVVLFSDRELERWFINGDVNPRAYERLHDLTVAIAIAGIRSLPQMIEILADCLNLFYGTSNIALSENLINITAQTVQAANFQAMNGASGSIVDSQGKTLATVEHGIITEIF